MVTFKMKLLIISVYICQNYVFPSFGSHACDILTVCRIAAVIKS